ncbi:MAG: right-handed parallel beta-helix repeat-containing protein, partial [Phycisphaerae bacterium]|nr:right-handed parallel beta-helix repeat-containing protein [Phycisphaerae bacterium]
MKHALITFAVLLLCSGAMGKPAPTRVDASGVAAQGLTGVLSLGNPLVGRQESSPLAAGPLDDAGASVMLSGGQALAGVRGTDYFVSTAGNDGNDGLDPLTPWLTIQHAVQTAPDGSTIHVASGTYVEVGQIAISANLMIVGDPAGWPIVKPAQDTGSSGDARGWWLINAGKDLTLQYLVLDGDSPTRKVEQAVRANGTVTVDNCELRNIKYQTYLGIGIVLFGNGTVSNCTFSSIERIGVIAYGSDVTGAMIYANTYTGKGPTDCVEYGVELGGGAVATVANNSITGCTGVASSDGSTSAAILITTYYGAGTAGTVLGNTLTGNTEAIAVGYDGSDSSAVVAHFNDVSGCTSGGIGSTNPTVDAEKNWWGTTDSTTIATLVWGNVDYTPFLLTDQIRMAFGGNRLAAMQNADGGWGWPLAGTSALNTLGPITMGLGKAYRATSDPDLRVALQKAGALLLTKTNNFSPSDGYLAAELDAILGGTTYVDHVTTNFYDKLATTSYYKNGGATAYSTATYVQLIRDSRASQGIANLAAWDVGMGLVGAASCGVTGSDLDAWIAGVEDEINELDGNDYYDVIGLAGAVYALAFVGEEFDPNSGEHSGAASLADLAGILASYQIAESGGFAWNRDFVIPYDYNETTQETAYAMLALEEVGGYASELADAKDYLLGVQLDTGGWENYIGSTSGENNEVTGEALWGIWAQSHAELTLEPDSDCYSMYDTVTVEIWMHDVDPTITGGQFFLEYDTSKLAFVSADPADVSPFTMEVFENTGTGTLDYATGIPYGGTGTSGDAKMAILEFTALVPICTEVDLITWRPHNPPTRLSDSLGQAVYADTVAMDVIDDVPPTITCPADFAVECEGDVPAAYVDLAEFLTAGGTASDNCGVALVLSLTSDSGLSGGICGGTVTRVYRVTDDCGNYAECTQIITVDDTTNPTITCPSDFAVECEGNVPTPYADLTAFLAAGGTAGDNCDTALTLSLTSDSGLSGGICGGTVTRVYRVTDDCGNYAECTQVITVDDTTNPTITCPSDFSVQCEGDVPTPYADLAAFLAAGGTAGDNCDTALT